MKIFILINEKQMSDKSGKSGKSEKCEVCRKKIGLCSVSCSCGVKTCMNHRYPELHNCKRDFKREGERSLKKNNPEIVADKLKNRLNIW